MFNYSKLNKNDFNFLLSVATNTNMTDHLKDNHLSISHKLKLYILLLKYKYMKNIYYAAGLKEYSDAKFIVNKNVLVPRNETELLIKYVSEIIIKENIPLSFLDIGTGSGVIAITLNKIFPNAKIDAFDISKVAIKVAKANNKLNNTNVNFFINDVNNPHNKKYNIIISNPPYIANNDWVDENVLKTEPHIALFAGKSGLEFYDIIINKYINNIITPGLIAFEVGDLQADLVKKLILKKRPNADIIIKKDFNNIDRFIIAIIK